MDDQQLTTSPYFKTMGTLNAQVVQVYIFANIDLYAHAMCVWRARIFKKSVILCLKGCQSLRAGSHFHNIIKYLYMF
jgi:hypothetical protein